MQGLSYPHIERNDSLLTPEMAGNFVFCTDFIMCYCFAPRIWLKCQRDLLIGMTFYYVMSQGMDLEFQESCLDSLQKWLMKIQCQIKAKTISSHWWNIEFNFFSRTGKSKSKANTDSCGDPSQCTSSSNTCSAESINSQDFDFQYFLRFSRFLIFFCIWFFY